MRKLFLVLSTISLFSCAHSEPDRSAEEATTIKRLALPAVESGLQQVREDLEIVDDRIRAAEARRNAYQVQATQDPNKQSAVEGVEAELASLHSRRSQLEHRKHLLDGRMRELGGNNEN